MAHKKQVEALETEEIQNPKD